MEYQIGYVGLDSVEPESSHSATYRIDCRTLAQEFRTNAFTQTLIDYLVKDGLVVVIACGKSIPFPRITLEMMATNLNKTILEFEDG